MALLTTTTTVVFATSLTVLEITSVGVSGTARVTVKVSHLTTSGGYDEFLLGDLVDAGQLDLEAFLSAKTFQDLLTADNQQVTVTFRIEDGDATGTTLVFDGGLTNEDFSGALEEAFTSSLSVKFLSAPTITPGAP